MPNPLSHGTPCVFLIQKKVPDGLGSYLTKWLPEGAPFLCLIGKSRSIDQLIAQKEGNNAVFDITVAADLNTAYHAVFKEVETGRIYRIVEDPSDNIAPKIATCAVKAGKAEAYTLPEDEE